MKIAVIVGTFPTISETFILNQITGLIDLGHKVDIFAFGKSKEEEVHTDIIEYNLFAKATYFDKIPETRIKRIFKAIIIILRYFVFRPKEIIKCLNYKKYESKYNTISKLLRLAPFLKKKYDVIHCHFGPNGIETLFLKEVWGRNVKHITTFRGYDVAKYINESNNCIYRDLFNEGDLFLPISNLWKKRLEELGCPSEKIIVHRMGINIEECPFRMKPINHSIKILTVARLVEKKGLKYSISAVARLIKKYPQIKYSIVGDGHLREELKDLIISLGVEDKIKLLGWMESDRVRELMYEAHILVLSSVTSNNGDQEGIPVSLMEAMSTGLPVISSYHSGIPELVTDKQTGFLVPEKDIDAIVEKIEYLITHPEVWPEMGRAGRKFVEENFDIRKLNRRLVEIYKNGNKQ